MKDIEEFLLLCLGVNYALLLTWFALFVWAHDWAYRIHLRWAKLSVETFDAMHLGGISLYKLAVVFFNLVPLIALYLMNHR